MLGARRACSAEEFSWWFNRRIEIHDTLIGQMEEINDRLTVDRDERRYFHGAYLRSTKAVLAEAEAGGFIDGEWAERWGRAFAHLYLDAFTAWERGDDVPAPWRVTFEASSDPDIIPLRHSLLGINAHINYDLPQAFLAVITDEEFGDAGLMARRAADHAHVDSILVSRVREEDKRMARLEDPGDRSIVDRLMSPFNRAGTKRLLKEGREKVWHNTFLLSAARGKGPEAYANKLAALEALCQARVNDLITPRYVIIHLARKGFGVTLPS
jgi:hypothetical protein